MYIALSLMFVGIFIGRGLRNRIKFSLSPYIMVVICLLLAVLGIELGFNKELISKFAGIGLSAFVISLFAVIGSCIASWFLWLQVKEKPSSKSDREESINLEKSGKR
jgi:uncharacterized membrane protein YbjE (DUF340 family)